MENNCCWAQKAGEHRSRGRGPKQSKTAEFVICRRFCLAACKTDSKEKGVERKIGKKRIFPACPLDKCCPEENSEVWEHSGFHRVCQTAVNSCLKACLAGLHTMYQSSQTEHSSFTSFFHMLVLTSAKQRHSAKADFFCPAWKLAPLHCFQASFFVPRWTLLQYETSEVWATERAEAQY